MFESSAVMIITTDPPPDNIFRLEVDAETQKLIGSMFSNSALELTKDKQRIVFNGSYKPQIDEYLAIENFSIPAEVLDAVRNPLGVSSFKKNDGNFPEIKAVFVGEFSNQKNGEEVFCGAFQRFKKNQYISNKSFNLFFNNATFYREQNFGISIGDSVDCCVSENTLNFTSFYFARQIFDLSEYYRLATDREVDAFAAADQLLLEDVEFFKGNANSWLRRKIAVINDSEVLTRYSAPKIKSLAKTAGINIDIENMRLVLPSDREKIKIILGFLDEEAYKGPFSQNTFLAGSKRRVNK